MSGRVSAGMRCYPKVLAERDGSVLAEKLTRRIIAMIQEETGLDLLDPCDEVRPGDRIVGIRGLDETIHGGEGRYETRLKELVSDLSDVVRVDPDEDILERANEVEARVTEIAELLFNVHDSVKELDGKCELKQIVGRVDKMVSFISTVKESVGRENDEDETAALEEVGHRLTELEAARVFLEVGEWKEVAEAAFVLNRTRKELKELRAAVIPLMSKIGAHIDSPDSWLPALERRVSIAAPLLERLLGSPVVSTDSVADALAALGPAPEF